MKKIIIFLSFILLVLFFNSCEVDDYELPNMTLEGKVVDQLTGENIQTRQPDGIRIRLYEEGFPVPLNFWAMSDGNFRNTKLFAAKYEVIATEGNFDDSSVDAIEVDLRSSNQTIVFEVEPYIRLKNVNISVSGGTITATYNIEPTTRTPISSLLICHNSLHLHEATIGVIRSATNNLEELTNEQITPTTFTDQITGLAPGTYYARVAVLTQNTLSRYNYSPIIQLDVP